MTSLSIRPAPLLRLSCLLLWAALHGAAAQATPPPSAQVFFQDAKFSNLALSPNGRMLAMVVGGKGVRGGLVVVDLASMTPRVLARYANSDVDDVSWLNDKRLMYTQLNLPNSVSTSKAGVYAVNLDGTQSKGLHETVVGPRSFADDSFETSPVDATMVCGLPAKISNNLFIRVSYEEEKDTDLASLDTFTGKVTTIAAPDGTFHWIYDEKDELRVAVSRNGDKETVELKTEANKWRKLGNFLPAADNAFTPLVYAGGTLYVHANKGGDRRSLYRFDLAKLALEDLPLVSSPLYDVDGHALTDGKHILGYRFRVDAQETVWFDAEMKSTQKDVDALLPATVNKLSRAYRPETPYVLVESASPRHPPRYLIYNQQTKQLSLIGKELDEIDTAQMGAMDMVHYKARDGMDVPAYVTLPNVALKKNLPTIIYAGSSPWSRNGFWSWDPTVQFLASRGYAVIQPDARGVKGFGNAHAKAGIKQWGLGMQDDLADGARWAIAQGIADPKRICIIGTTYGGYAALMGMVKDPDLFQCAVSWAGIVDIELMFQHKWAGFSGGNAKMKALVGDPSTDQAQFSATSPLKNAAKIKGPVLLAYGAHDVKVPAKHGRMLYDALKASNPAAEFYLYDEKGQDWSLAGNRADLWSKIDSFLERHIGKTR